MKIIGIDPGYDRLGVSIIESKNNSLELVEALCITSNNKLKHPERLLQIGNELEKTIKKHTPLKAMAVENVFFTKNQKTATQVSEAKGVIVYLSQKHSIPVFEYSPVEIKNTITGYGKADKKQVIYMTQQLIKIPKNIKLDDIYDSIAIALTMIFKNKDLL